VAPRSRLPSPSLRSRWCWSRVWLALPRWPSSCVASIQQGKQCDWLPEVTKAARWRWPAGSLRRVHDSSYGTMVTSWSPPSPQAPHRGYPSTSRRKRSPLANQESDRGSATVVAVAMMALLMSITLGIMVFGTAVMARHRAQAAADLAALAAAGRLASGSAAACASATSVVTSMRATLLDCRVEQLDVIIGVDVRVQLHRWGVGSARAQARAGPVDPPR
jgi:secretion/DNA translocation related TadE-like protein